MKKNGISIISRTDKKGQIAGQIFTYMMAAIIVGVIALIAYKAISGIVTRTCNAEAIGFQTDLNGLIEKYNSHGLVEIRSLRAPCDYDTLCFVSQQDLIIAQNFQCTESAIIIHSVEQHAVQNIFALAGDRTIPLGYSDLVSLNATDSGKCLCIKARNGNFDIRFSGRGASTEISAK